MSQTIADSTLGLSGPALSILAILAQREPDFAPYDRERHEYQYVAQTSAWYNGREQGVCLVIRPYGHTSRKCLLVTFGEHRSSDNIFVDAWESEGTFLNPPTVEDYSDEAYKARKFFDYGRVDQAVSHIVAVIRAFIEEPVDQGRPRR